VRTFCLALLLVAQAGVLLSQMDSIARLGVLSVDCLNLGHHVQRDLSALGKCRNAWFTSL
jgi:hypothetical protein